MTEKIQYDLDHQGVCTPSYFRGHHKPVLQVPIWREMTKAELTEAIISEYNEVYDYLTYPQVVYDKQVEWPDLSKEELLEMCDRYILQDEPFKNTGVPTLEACQEDDGGESPYIYVVWEERV